VPERLLFQLVVSCDGADYEPSSRRSDHSAVGLWMPWSSREVEAR
jgi:hypothetical protein